MSKVTPRSVPSMRLPRPSAVLPRKNGTFGMFSMPSLMSLPATSLSRALSDSLARAMARSSVPGTDMELNVELEKALRLSDFIEIAELMARDALLREESCGGHFREEHQTEDGEALRDDEHFAYVSCWKYTGEGSEPELLKEPLNYEFVQRQQRNYKA